MRTNQNGNVSNVMKDQFDELDKGMDQSVTRWPTSEPGAGGKAWAWQRSSTTGSAGGGLCAQAGGGAGTNRTLAKLPVEFVSGLRRTGGSAAMVDVRIGAGVGGR